MTLFFEPRVNTMLEAQELARLIYHDMKKDVGKEPTPAGRKDKTSNESKNIISPHEVYHVGDR